MTDIRDARLDARQHLTTQYVLVSSIAAKLGISGNVLNMKLKRQGYALSKIPNPENGHLSMAVSVLDAKKIYNDERQKPQVVSLEEALQEEQ